MRINDTIFNERESSQCIFPKNITKRPMSDRTTSNSATEFRKPTIENFENTKFSKRDKMGSRAHKTLRDGAKDF